MQSACVTPSSSVYVGFPTHVQMPVWLKRKKEWKHDKTGLKKAWMWLSVEKCKRQLHQLHAGFGTPCSLSLLKYIFVSGSGGEGGRMHWNEAWSWNAVVKAGGGGRAANWLQSSSWKNRVRKHFNAKWCDTFHSCFSFALSFPCNW